MLQLLFNEILNVDFELIQDREEYTSIIERLGGDVIDSQGFDSTATHLVLGSHNHYNSVSVQWLPSYSKDYVKYPRFSRGAYAQRKVFRKPGFRFVDSA